MPPREPLPPGRVRTSPVRKWTRHPGPSVRERVLVCLRTPGVQGQPPVPWTVAELAAGTGAHPTTVADALAHLEGHGVERAGTEARKGARGRSSRVQLWRAK